MKKAKKAPAKKAAKPDHDGMSGAELWDKLQQIGFSQVGFARAIKVGERSMRRWISGDDPVPCVIATLVNLMIKTKSGPEDLQA